MNEKELIIQQHEENAWLIIDSDNGSIKDIITKDDIVEYCKRECEMADIVYMCVDGIVEGVWWEINDKYDLELVDNYCEEFEKFCKWFDFICVEYLTNELITYYKQRLLNFE